MKRILILIALLNLSASQIAVGQEDGQLGFECYSSNLSLFRFFKVNMTDSSAEIFDTRREQWGAASAISISRNQVNIVANSYSTFTINRTTLAGSWGSGTNPFSCTIMSWDEVDQKAAANLAELNKDRAF
jgi:hypothetical protein